MESCSGVDEPGSGLSNFMKLIQISVLLHLASWLEWECQSIELYFKVDVKWILISWHFQYLDEGSGVR